MTAFHAKTIAWNRPESIPIVSDRSIAGRLRTMNTYGVQPEGYRPIQKRVLFGSSISLAVALLVVGYLVKPSSGRDFTAFGLTAVTFAILGVVILSRSIRRIREVWSTYVLTIGEDYLLKQQSYYPDIRINKDEIKIVQKSFTGDIVIKTKDWRKFIIIPRSLNGLEEVERLLATWKPITLYSKRKMVLTMLAAFVLFLGCLGFGAYFLSGQKLTITTIYSGAIVIMILAVIGMWQLRRIQNLDERSKPKRWQLYAMIGYIILMLISMAVFHFLKSH